MWRKEYICGQRQVNNELNVAIKHCQAKGELLIQVITRRFIASSFICRPVLFLHIIWYNVFIKNIDFIPISTHTYVMACVFFLFFLAQCVWLFSLNYEVCHFTISSISLPNVLVITALKTVCKDTLTLAVLAVCPVWQSGPLTVGPHWKPSATELKTFSDSITHQYVYVPLSFPTHNGDICVSSLHRASRKQPIRSQTGCDMLAANVKPV